MGRTDDAGLPEVRPGDTVYLAGVRHIADNRGTVVRVWANGWVEVSFPGWTWVGSRAEVQPLEGPRST